MFLLEETRQKKQEESGQQALVAQSSQAQSNTVGSHPSSQQPAADQRGGGASRGRGCGRGTNNKPKGRGKGRGNNNNNQQQQQSGPQWQAQQQQAPQWDGQPFWKQLPNGQWASPPCPFPTSPAQQQYRGSSPSILGPRPPQQQAYDAQPSYGQLMTPTAYSSMSLQSADNGWYMDTGASSHMTRDLGPSFGDNSSEVQ
ncbi:protein PRRC2A-like [Chenopodium quinoa]|uniref:protein PRRC2A-like n=1 Tax=Chenopodium quinoa TaxID=63459 RepID=UPI000B77D038|nr:protein PRRC2A-like [Chenopodium quinoa]